MANLEFNQQDIENLVDKLVPVTGTLTEQERMLLVAIFAAAANRAEQSDPDAALLPAPEIWGHSRGAGARRKQQPTADQLKQQLLNGYVPGKDLGTVTHSTDKVVGKRI